MSDYNYVVIITSRL